MTSQQPPDTTSTPVINTTEQNIIPLPNSVEPVPPSTPVDKANIVGVHFKIGKKIGEGSFGIIYEGIYVAHLTKGLNLLSNAPIAIKLEARKTEAPQLRDEYRTYKVLAGTRDILDLISSWSAFCLLLWTRGTTQCTLHGSSGAFFGGHVRPVQQMLHRKDNLHGGDADGLQTTYFLDN